MLYFHNSKCFHVLNKAELFCDKFVFGNNHPEELQWLEHPQDYENMFETGVIRANE